MLRVLLLIGILIGGGFSLSAQQDLIPMPVHTKWEQDCLDLSKGISISKEGEVGPEVQFLEDMFSRWGIPIYRGRKSKDLPVLSLSIAKVAGGEEAYRLMVTKYGIRIEGSSTSGLFYGMQTLRQFLVNQGKIQCVTIEDCPAFSWRAFLVDIGRNYQSVEMLKEQIDVMAQYKLNVLHFHFTEDIAWRLISKRYPGLTAASNMTRWSGKYYTEEDFRTLINYCKERHIMFLPEIDMPGHSSAFKRFFGVDMQSDSGVVYIKSLLQEFKATYPELAFLHIGGDEVKITNKDFMPEITRYVQTLGYKTTVGWDPGSNLSTSTWRQLWMGGASVVNEEGDLIFIDSKHLYINHMDPLETVTTLFHRKIGGQAQEHKNLKGATLCAWPDRAVAKPMDMFYQNAIYPSILTFGERIWRGGGVAHWVCNMMSEDTIEYQKFEDFERRLLVHKDRYFKNKPFPYVKQSGLKWDLIGPFDNNGDLSQIFDLEKEPFNDNMAIYKRVEGATVILRHWWADVIQGAIDDPRENTTWYARTEIWSEQAGIRSFWIGFNDLSRSYASDSPKLNTWDDRCSGVRINATWISPPKWKQAGMKGDLEKPLLDEGYTYRSPTSVFLQKGWNEVLVKLPVGSFKGTGWQTPVKWMFTFVAID